jgi:hypothetical protein
MRDGRFATAINCIDGRVQIPVLDWIRFYLNVDYVDLITEPGPDKVIISGSEMTYNAIFEKATLSIKTLGSQSISIVGHHDCRANPVSKEEHIEQIQSSVEIIEKWRLGVRILGLWVNEWSYIEVIRDTEKRLSKTGLKAAKTFADKCVDLCSKMPDEIKRMGKKARHQLSNGAPMVSRWNTPGRCHVNQRAKLRPTNQQNRSR